MEINATNEAHSTENENAAHDTWFRLSLSTTPSQPSWTW